MKKILSLVTILFFAFQANAQYEQGQSDINIGVGFLTLGLDGDGGFPIGVSYDYMLTDEFSLGLGAGFVSSSVDLIDGTKAYDVTYLNFAVRGLYHIDLLDPLDTYGGVVLGYTSGSISYADGFDNSFFQDLSVSSVYYGFILGTRYRFTDNIGAFAEIGYALSPVTIGLNVMF